MKDSQPTTLLLSGVAAILVLFLCWPVWQWLWNEWMHNEYYSHGLLIPFVSLFLAVQRIRLRSRQRSATSACSTPHPTPNNAHSAPTPFVWLWLGGSLLLYLLYLYDSAYYLAAFAAIALIAGLVWLFGGTALLHEWSFPLIYLVLMVPLPFVERATYPLAIFAGVCGGGLVKWLGMELSIVGNAITLPNADLVIGAQCSGINSLIALSALMAVAAYVLDGPLWGRITLVLLAIPLAISGNILRIASLLFVARTYGTEAAFVFYHDYSGIAFFLVVLLLMFPLTRLLQLNKLRHDVI